MFTGIVEETGTVTAFVQASAAWSLELAAPTVGSGVAIGDSVSVNGCCLTVVSAGEGRLAFDVLEETRRLTSFRLLKPGSRVNLERSLAAGGRLGGHFVTGHIDGPGTIEIFERRGNDQYLRIRGPAGSGSLLVPKGSIAVDGISLTVAEVDADSFAVWIIPHTLEVTNLGNRAVGEPVNLEFDILGKYVEKLLGQRKP